MADVVWTESAMSDLREIVRFVRQQSPEKARALAARLAQAPMHLSHSPRMGRVAPKVGDEHIRELVSLRPYRIFYVIRDDTCYVARIFHSSRDLSDFLRPENFEEIG